MREFFDNFENNEHSPEEPETELSSSGSNTEDAALEELMQKFQECAHLLQHRRGSGRGRNLILSVLLKNGSMTQRELLDHCSMRSASLSELLMKAEASGLITRQRDDSDRRNINISLTKSGEEVAKRHGVEMRCSGRSAFSCLSHDEIQQLSELLGKLLDQWESEDAPCGKERRGCGKHAGRSCDERAEHSCGRHAGRSCDERAEHSCGRHSEHGRRCPGRKHK